MKLAFSTRASILHTPNSPRLVGIILKAARLDGKELQETLEFSRQGAIQEHHLARPRMLELNCRGVEEVPSQRLHFPAPDSQFGRRAVECVSNHRMTGC